MNPKTENGTSTFSGPMCAGSGSADPEAGKGARFLISGDDPRIDEPLREYLAALEAGQPVDRNEFLARHPDIAALLTECLDGLEFIHAAALQMHNPAPDPHEDGVPCAPEMRSLAPLGDYRIVRLAGRGGMGVVYEAVQLSLRRKVALKVLPFAAAIDPKQLQRFQREARAAAQLHHSNIVPVYAVGCERGVHYYAMQFIEGHTLADTIVELRRLSGRDGAQDCRALRPAGVAAPSAARGAAVAQELRDDQGTSSKATLPMAALSTQRSAGDPAFYRTVAHLGVQAALALEHAHQHGVVHRDIKPGNLLVDERGDLWVSDFGLAHFQAEAGPTLSGDLVGTFRYMSPEQALAKHWLMDHRTDVYSLGATLYELLTLEPAFGGSDRQEVLRQIAEEDPLPPRRRNRAIPVELETIVLKAMEKDPNRRYATAQELADDLRRFLEDKPIRARRPTLRQVAVKWARRHRGIVWTAITAAVLGLLMGVAVLVASNLRIRQEKAQAEVARQRADRNAELAIRALDRAYLRIVEDRSPRDPVQTQEDRDLLKLALDFYQEVARENSADPVIRQTVVNACLRVGDIQAHLGQYALAREALERALALSAQLTAERPTDYDARAALAHGHQSLARLSAQTNDTVGAVDHHRQARSLWEQLVHDFPDLPQARKMLADSHTAFGMSCSAVQAWHAAEYCFKQAEPLRVRLAADHPTELGYAEDLARNHSNLGQVLAETGRGAEAEAHLRKALDVQSRLVADSPKVPRYRQQEAQSACNLASLLAGREDPSAAHTCYQRALDLRTRLVAEFPSVPEYRHELAVTHEKLVLLLTKACKQAEAGEHFRQAMELRSRLIADFPAVYRYRQEQVELHRILGNLLAQVGDREAAVARYRNALDIMTKLIADLPKPYDQQEYLAMVHIDLGDRLLSTGELTAAREHLNQGMSILEPIVAAGRTDPNNRLNLGNAHNNLGIVLEAAGEWLSAEHHFRQALVLWSRLTGDYPDKPWHREYQAMAHRNLGDLLHAKGEHAAASEHFRQAIALWAPLAEKATNVEKGGPSMALHFLAELLANCPDVSLRDTDRAVGLARKAVAACPHSVACKITLVLAYYRVGDPRAARNALEPEAQTRRRWNPEELFLRAMIHWRLNNSGQARRCYDQAVHDMEAHWPGSISLQRYRSEAAGLLGVPERSSVKGMSP